MTRAMMSVVLSVGMAMAPVTVQAAQTQTQAGAASQEAAPVDPRVRELQQMYAEAQDRVSRFNRTNDKKHLREAQSLLQRWLTQHTALYGHTEAAVGVRAPVQEQLDSIEAQLAPPPPVVVAPAPAPAPVDQPPPQSSPDDVGKGLINGGIGLLSLGAAASLGVGLPLWVLRNESLNDARRETFHVRQQEDIDRARRRQTGAISMFAIGGSLALGGILMIVGGSVQRSKARRQVAVTPQFGRGFAGASATVRF